MTYKGRADMLTTSTQPQKFNELFSGIVKFLSGSAGQALGITLVESNYGVNGRGLGFWDQSDNAGLRSWAVFRFTSASLGAFDMAIFVNSGSGGKNDPWQVGTIVNSGDTGVQGNVGIAFAATPSGSIDPWNGSSGSFVSGTAGNPVWRQDSAGRLAVFPRQNSIDGTFSAKRNYACAVNPDDGSQVFRHHLVISEESYTHAISTSDNQLYRTAHFGPWQLRSGSSPDCPYAYFSTLNTNTNVDVYNLLYGSTTSNAFTTREGGIAHPLNLASGSRTMTLVTIGQGNNAGLDTAIGAFNAYINSGSFDLLPCYAAIKDGGDTGILGAFRNIQMAYNVPAHTVTPGSGSAVFGGNTAGNLKLVTPWSGSAPGSSGTRFGRDWG